MESARFDTAIRMMSDGSSRRGVLGTLAATVAGLVLARRSGAVDARSRRRKKKRRRDKDKRQELPPFNAFGCLDVGQQCLGQDEVCCSGRCEGKKPKRGARDTRTCAAHNTGGCTPERDACLDPEGSLCGTNAACLTTTGNSGFCADSSGFSLDVNCRPCSKDTECEALGFRAGSACVVLRVEGACLPGDTCEGINGSSGTACAEPGA